MKKYRVTLSLDGTVDCVYYMEFDAENVELCVQRVYASLERTPAHEDDEIVAIFKMAGH